MGVVGEQFELDPHKGFKVEIKESFFSPCVSCEYFK